MNIAARPPNAPLRLRLTLQDDKIVPQITPPQEPPIAALLQGRSTGDAAVLVGRVFNLCASAQEAATRSSFGLEPDPTLPRRIAAETVREHILKLCLIWPPLLDLAPDRDIPGLLNEALRSPASAMALRLALFAPAHGPATNWAAFEAWMTSGANAVARSFAKIAQDWDPAWGRTASDLPLLDPTEEPDWPKATQNGLVVENSVAARMADALLMQEIEARFGRGPLWRMTARLVDLDRLLSPGVQLSHPRAGVIEAARGWMLVRGFAVENQVTGFQRLSPTDFALLPEGLLAQTMASLPCRADIPLPRLARLVLETIDPCVMTELSWSEEIAPSDAPREAHGHA